MDIQAALDDCNRTIELFNQRDHTGAVQAVEAWVADYLSDPPAPVEFHQMAHAIAEIGEHLGRADLANEILQQCHDVKIDEAVRDDCNRLIGLMNEGKRQEAVEFLRQHVWHFWAHDRLLWGSLEVVKLLRFNAIHLGLFGLLPALDRTFYRMKLYGWDPAHRAGAQSLLIPGLEPIELLSEGDCFICEGLDRGGVFEPTSLEVWAALSQKADIVADIGANVGVYSLVAAMASTSAAVHAFEALPEAADRLDENIRHSGLDNIIVHRTAVSDADGTVAFKYLPLTPGNFICRVGAIDEDRAGYQSIDVPRETLDAALPPAAGARLLVKIDTEGHEAKVLAGMEGWLANGSVEFLIESFAPDQCEEIARRLTPLGYRYYRILEGDHRLQPLKTFTPSYNQARHDFNTLCTRRPEDELRALLPPHCEIDA